MPYIPVDTAVQLIVGPLIDDTDFKSLETGVAYNAAGMSLDLIKSSISGTPSKTDLTLTTGGSQDWVELGNGMYYVEITAAQNNTEGELQLVGVATGILPFISAKYQVVPVAVFNSLVGGSDNLQVDAIEISGDATAANNCESFFDGTGYAGTNNVIPTVTTLTGHTAQTGDSFARIGATGSGLTSLATQASVDTVDGIVDTILVDTADLQANQGNWLTATGFSTHTALDVWHVAASSVVTASTIGLQLKTNVDAVMSNIETDTADLQTQIGTAGNGLTDLPDQSMNIIGNITGNLSGSVGSVTGSVGSVTGSVGSVVGHTAQTGDTYALANGAAGFVAIDTVVDAILVDTGTTLETHLADIKGGTFSGATDSLEAIRDRGDAAWTTGAGGSSPTVEEIRAEIDSNSTQLAAILADTNELQTDDIPTTLATLATASALATVDSNVDAILLDTGTTIPGTITTMQGNVTDILADTNELQTDWANAGRLDTILDTAAAAGSGNVTQILGTALNETSAGYLAAAFEYFFDVATPAKTVNDVGVAGSGLTAAEVRTEMDSNSTQLIAIKTKTDLITSGSLTSVARGSASSINLFVGETHTYTLTTEDYQSKTLELAFDGTDVADIADGALTKTASSVSFSIPSTLTNQVRNLRWALRDTANGNEVLMLGNAKVSEAPT